MSGQLYRVYVESMQGRRVYGLSIPNSCHQQFIPVYIGHIFRIYASYILLERFPCHAVLSDQGRPTRPSTTKCFRPDTTITIGSDMICSGLACQIEEYVGICNYDRAGFCNVKLIRVRTILYWSTSVLRLQVEIRTLVFASCLLAS